jgi:hypothetical protein
MRGGILYTHMQPNFANVFWCNWWGLIVSVVTRQKAAPFHFDLTIMYSSLRVGACINVVLCWFRVISRTVATYWAIMIERFNLLVSQKYQWNRRMFLFLNVKLCRHVEVYRHCGGTYCFCLYGQGYDKQTRSERQTMSSTVVRSSGQDNKPSGSIKLVGVHWLVELLLASEKLQSWLVNFYTQ